MKNRRKQRSAHTHAPMWAAIVVVVVIAFAGFMGVKGVLGVIDEWTQDLPDVSSSDAFNYSQKSVVYAADGETILAEFELENRDPLDSLDSISTDLLNATIATEDMRFYQHNGVDLYGIARALVNNLLGGEIEGASTITQQLVRNTILIDEMTDISYERKVREAQLAINMEKVYSKDEILLMYLNTINYGDGAYGIEAAAEHYFSIHASELTLVQAATLAAIPNSPTAYNPVYNPDACVERRNLVLNRMLSQGYITQEQYDEAVATELELNVKSEDSYNGIYKYPYFTSYVRDWLQENYTTAELFAGGLDIYTTLDISKQEQAEYACDEQNSKMASALETAMVAIDPSNGYVVSMVGGKDFGTDQFNIATQKGRPTGSTFKVFTLVTAIEEGIDPNTYINCSSKYTLKSGNGTVENFGGINYGTRTIASATAVSSNTAYVQLQEQLGGSKIIEVARRMGIKDASLSVVDTLTLGVYDITPLEMASAYATLASGGIYHEPHVVSKIIDSNGEVMYEADTEGERVLDENIAGAVTDVLKTVFTSYEGTGYSAQLDGGRPVAGKTGTSSDFRDHWMCGYTPDLVSAFWIGDRSNNYMSEDIDCNWVFKTFMNNALYGTDFSYFPSYTTPTYDSELNYAFAPKSAPSVVGKSKDDATYTINASQSSGYFSINYAEEYSDTVAAGYVISQSQSGTTVTLVISKGIDPSKKAAEKEDTGGDSGESSDGGSGGSDSGGGGSSSSGGSHSGTGA